MTLHPVQGADAPQHFEIVRGEVVPLMPTGDLHGIVESRVIRLLGNEAEEAGLGIVLGGEVGVVVEHDPRTVREADAAFFLTDQLPYRTTSERYLLTPPALVVEVLSPNDRASDVHRKVLEYLEVGVQVVWVVDPATRSVAVFLEHASTGLLRGDDPLSAPGVLDELRTPVLWLFKELPGATQPPQE